MPAASRLKRSILSLSSAQFRVGWLRDHLFGLTVEVASEQLAGLCAEGEQADPDAREALLALVMLLAELGDCEWVDGLRAAARAGHLWSLERLLRRQSPAPAVERRFEQQPVPDYGAGRELTVGERRSLARRPDRSTFEKLLADPHPLVLTQLMQNPRLTEDDVVFVATRRPARREALRAIAASPRWLRQTRVRMAILQNPGSPASVAVPLLALCTRQELRQLTEAADASSVLRVTARELLERRPPLPEVAPENRRLQ